MTKQTKRTRIALTFNRNLVHQKQLFNKIEALAINLNLPVATLLMDFLLFADSQKMFAKFETINKALDGSLDSTLATISENVVTTKSVSNSDPLLKKDESTSSETSKDKLNKTTASVLSEFKL